MTPVKNKKRAVCKMIVIGGSAGGVEALTEILDALPKGFALSIAVVLHLHVTSDTLHLANRLSKGCPLEISEAEERETPTSGQVYLAPANYHLLFEPDGRFALSVDEKVNYSRPSIDMLFESAADAYGDTLIGVLLSGASCDGAAGIQRIRELGGLTIVQDPQTAESKFMPQSALKLGPVDHCESPAEIGRRLRRIASVVRVVPDH